MRSVIFFFLLITINSYSQNETNNHLSSGSQQFAVDQLKEDFKVFRGSLEDFHPGLYWYRPREEMNKCFDEVFTSLNEPLTEMEFYRRLTPVVAKLGCGHTELYPSDNSYRKMKRGQFFPFKLKFIDNHAYCLQNYSADTSSILPGHEIVGINGLRMDSIINRIIRETSGFGDGYVTSGKLRYLDWEFMDQYALTIGQSEKYEILYVDISGNKKTVNLKALSKEQIKRNIEERQLKQPDNRNDRISLKLLGDSEIAVLKIENFGDRIYGKKFTHYKFEKELKKKFEAIDSSKVNSLIVDLRNNGGGKDIYGLNLFSYFYDKPIVEFNKMEVIANKSAYLKHSDLNRFTIWLYMNILNRSKKINDSTFQILSEKTLKPYPSSVPQFKGKVYVIINGLSYSTTADFIALMKSYQLATFIGEETGGGYYGNTSGGTTKVVLPNTKLVFDVPLVRYTTNVKPVNKVGRGIKPDYPVQPAINDLIKGVDTEMNFTLELINQAKRE